MLVSQLKPGDIIKTFTSIQFVRLHNGHTFIPKGSLLTILKNEKIMPTHPPPHFHLQKHIVTFLINGQTITYERSSHDKLPADWVYRTLDIEPAKPRGHPQNTNQQ